jgi:DNA-binding XRE family transcriptional regulator
MSDSTRQERGLIQAKANLADLLERGEEAVGESWADVEKELFTQEEIAASNIRVGLMLELSKARHELGLSQRKLEALSGVKQPVIARMENGTTSPQLDTVIKVLAPLGKTLYIGDILPR